MTAIRATVAIPAAVVEQMDWLHAPGAECPGGEDHQPRVVFRCWVCRTPAVYCTADRDMLVADRADRFRCARCAPPLTARYRYLGAKGTDPRWVGQPCNPILRPDGKCIVGRQGGPRNQLVRFLDGSEVVVSARRLRLNTARTADSEPTPRRSLWADALILVVALAAVCLGLPVAAAWVVAAVGGR